MIPDTRFLSSFYETLFTFILDCCLIMPVPVTVVILTWRNSSYSVYIQKTNLIHISRSIRLNALYSLDCQLRCHIHKSRTSLRLQDRIPKGIQVAYRETLTVEQETFGCGQPEYVKGALNARTYITTRISQQAAAQKDVEVSMRSLAQSLDYHDIDVDAALMCRSHCKGTQSSNTHRIYDRLLLRSSCH